MAERTLDVGQPDSASPGFPGSDGSAVLIGYFRQMALIRSFELTAAEMYRRAKIGGYCHLNLGEEATVVGLMAALEPHGLSVHHLPRPRLRAVSRDGDRPGDG